VDGHDRSVTFSADSQYSFFLIEPFFISHEAIFRARRSALLPRSIFSMSAPKLDNDLNWNSQLREITSSLISMARLDFGNPPSIRGTSPLDAVAVGLQALAEELQATVVAKEEAEKANRAKTHFLGNMNHELRTPLMTIIGSADLLKYSTLDSEQSELLECIQGASEDLRRLVTDVLDFAIVEAGTLVLEPRPIAIRDILESAAHQHARAAELKGLSLQVTLDQIPDMPVLIDGGRAAQALHNLIGNAIKFTPAGEIRVTGVGTCKGLTMDLIIDVEDSGIGIAADQLGHIFERFSAGDVSRSRLHGGAGLGLTISRALIEAMGGVLSVKSALGEGTCFRISINVPIVEKEIGRPPLEEEAHPIRRSVLVVDDQAVVRRVSSDMLRTLGCNVDVAISGAEAQTKVSQSHYDLILMDCQMPCTDGLESTKRLLESHPTQDLTIVAMTAHCTAADEEASLQAGMKGHLNKPFTIDELRTVVERFTDLNEQSSAHGETRDTSLS
jgi:two-component system, sensor histidine kinase